MPRDFVETALIDQAWHRLGGGQAPADVDAMKSFETAALKDTGVGSDFVPPRDRTTYFAHTFASGYDASYYSNMWAEVLVAELEEPLAGSASILRRRGLVDAPVR